MYYKLYCDMGGGPNVYLYNLNNKFALIQEGRLVLDLEKEHIELPFKFEMDIQANPDGSLQEPRLEAYTPSKELMHKSLVAALQDAGVDNLQIFPAVVSREDEDILIEDYVVVNVVGLVSCADLESSESMPLADGLYFRNLVIDPARTNGLLMFRLAESKMDVLIHESVAEHLRRFNFPFLVLVPLDEV